MEYLNAYGPTNMKNENNYCKSAKNVTAYSTCFHFLALCHLSSWLRAFHQELISCIHFSTNNKLKDIASWLF